ncbi:DsbA family protein [Bacillus sp. FJAT-50079]|uniref:DsbA family protein n=1 Tax=Bacillus sp. FJAT-50079 TaxID=2833577 RepID=UPI001BC8E619|nr:DsbA family protein [Bacillus sp. FJAT-50079]MBS4210053.1 DsbA family protein [Bacillus sp. FJAT-50079]
MKINLICDLETGICGEAGEAAFEMIDLTQPKKTIDLYYVTDPICSHCWALEPVLRKFEAQYGHYFNMKTVMGGLLESWDGFADVNNGISGPADVAGHWQEVGVHSRMPIDGTVWFNNPIKSSFPPSRVYKIIQKQDETLATIFLRRIREELFAFNKNIAEDQLMIEVVNQLGLNGEEIVKQAHLEGGHQLLNEDFALSRSLGVRGFPTIIMVNEEKKGVKIVGARGLEYYVSGLQQILETEELQPKQPPVLADLLKKEERLFSKEIEVMYDIEQNEAELFIQKELSSESYTLKEILGEKYIEKK